MRQQGNDRLAQTATLHLPLDNVLNEAAVRGFAILRDAAVLAKGDAPW